MEHMTANQEFSATKPRLGRYVIDPDASSVVFRTRHLFGLAPVRGAFRIRAGTADVTEPLAASRIRVEIDAASFRTGNPARDGSVRSARFLDAGRHPVMVFVAEKMEGDALDGALTVCGTTRPVRLPAEVSVLPDGSLLARAAVRIDRTEFGITASPGLAGRFLDVTAEVRCVRRG
jgi:polyisoprenoid-binding protein YceI